MNDKNRINTLELSIICCLLIKRILLLPKTKRRTQFQAHQTIYKLIKEFIITHNKEILSANIHTQTNNQINYHNSKLNK